MYIKKFFIFDFLYFFHYIFLRTFQTILFYFRIFQTSKFDSKDVTSDETFYRTVLANLNMLITKILGKSAQRMCLEYQLLGTFA